jgi:hypothetical protein
VIRIGDVAGFPCPQGRVAFLSPQDDPRNACHVFVRRHCQAWAVATLSPGCHAPSKGFAMNRRVFTISALAGLLTARSAAAAFEVTRSDAEWRAMLSDLEYQVRREGISDQHWIKC